MIGTRRDAQTDTRVLAEIISTVASTLELDRVLAAIVGLLSEASAVHACFVYLLDESGEQLVLRAASDPFGGLVEQISLGRGEGLAWWAVERQEPAFIKDRALEDPRFKYVPELGEEDFQSLVSVPILSRSGDSIGAISLHTEAPREFTAAEVDFLVSSSSLVAGAIENARLYEETRRRMRQLERLNALGESLARATTRAGLLGAISAQTRDLLQAEACHLYTLAATGDRLTLEVSTPADAAAPGELLPADIGAELARGSPREPGSFLVPMPTHGELRNVIALHAAHGRAFSVEDGELARTAANQAALAIERLELIDRLREENLIGDFLDDLAAGARTEDLAIRAKRLGVDLAAPYLVLSARPTSHATNDAWVDRLETEVLRLAPGALVERRGDHLRGLLRARDPEQVTDALRQLHAGLDLPAVIGLSGPCTGTEALEAGFGEAQQAALAAALLEDGPPVRAYQELGSYRYLLRMQAGATDRDPLIGAARKLADYDQARSTSLLETLATYLRLRGSTRATAEALYVHPNTLRQRLGRIKELTDIDLANEDLLALEIAVRLVSLDVVGERADGGR